MAKVGQPISAEERRSRPLTHLIQYGLKMTVRRDLGGRDDIENHPEILGKKIVGMSAADAGKLFAAELVKMKNGIAERQRRTLEEIEWRAGFMLDSRIRATRAKAAGKHEEAYKIMCEANDMMVNGASPTVPTPETHILS